MKEKEREMKEKEEAADRNLKQANTIIDELIQEELPPATTSTANGSDHNGEEQQPPSPVPGNDEDAGLQGNPSNADSSLLDLGTVLNDRSEPRVRVAQLSLSSLSASTGDTVVGSGSSLMGDDLVSGEEGAATGTRGNLTIASRSGTRMETLPIELDDTITIQLAGSKKPRDPKTPNKRGGKRGGTKK